MQMTYILCMLYYLPLLTLDLIKYCTDIIIIRASCALIQLFCLPIHIVRDNNSHNHIFCYIITHDCTKRLTAIITISPHLLTFIDAAWFLLVMRCVIMYNDIII